MRNPNETEFLIQVRSAMIHSVKMLSEMGAIIDLRLSRLMPDDEKEDKDESTKTD